MAEVMEAGASWVDRLADEVERSLTGTADTAGEVVCHSGISPSGSVHLGNLREVFTTHLVAEALKDRGLKVVHLHSWDDYDRFRKVPAGVDPSFGEYVGMPLSAVPDPWGGEGSYADHFIAEFNASLARLGIDLHGVRQSRCYPAGEYNAEIRRAMEQRTLVFDTLAGFETPGRNDRPVEERRAEYYPFKPYCESCGKDFTTVRSYTDATVHYGCACGHEGAMSLADGARISGKLVWKVDWPMRWARNHVAFEPAGEDHHAPTGSFNVGRELVAKVFDGSAPHSAVYSFVRLAGAGGKMSGSAGGAANAATALEVLEPAMLRWLYTRRTPSQGFAIDLGPQAVQRLYDEWDAFSARASGPEAQPTDARLRKFCVTTSAGEVETSRRTVPFRLLASTADITQANTDQMARIVTQHLAEDDVPPPAELLAELEPRLTCAINWATRLLPEEDRTRVAETFQQGRWDELDDDTRHGVHLLAAGLADAWSLDGLTALVYGVPKRLLGLPEDTEPTPELKQSQRAFFRAVYRLLVGRDTGPRLPTLLLSLGVERSRELLIGPTTDPRGV